KNSLDIEDHEHQGEDVILNFELHPRVADGLNAALIGAVLDRVVFLRAQDQAVDEDWGPWKNCPHEEEDSNKQPLVRHNASLKTDELGKNSFDCEERRVS